MEDVKPEEKSPLLLYLVEGEGNVSKNNKRVNFDKGRLYGISSGATAVFTEFPNYVSPCWITTVLSGLIFFMMMLLLISSMSTGSNFRVPRCIHNHDEPLENKTIHLVHGISNWNQEELAILEQIRKEYEGYNVHLIMIRPEPKIINENEIAKLPTPLPFLLRNFSDSSLAFNTVNHAIIEIKKAKKSRKIRSPKRKKRERMADTFGMEVKSLLDILLHSRLGSSINSNNNRHLNDSKPINLTETLLTITEEPRPKTIDDVISNFPNLTIRNITFMEAFSKTPLEGSWFKLNTDLAVFALRCLKLWEHGGLSFEIDDLPIQKGWNEVDNFSVASESTLKTIHSSTFNFSTNVTPNDKLENFISSGRSTYENLPKEVVTADDEGLHIFSKTPCHVFFGEVLMNLKHARGDESPKNIIQKSLEVFCRHNAVGRRYCQKIVRSRG